jgi:hypothetical protein
LVGTIVGVESVWEDFTPSYIGLKLEPMFRKQKCDRTLSMAYQLYSNISSMARQVAWPRMNPGSELFSLYPFNGIT